MDTNNAARHYPAARNAAALASPFRFDVMLHGESIGRGYGPTLATATAVAVYNARDAARALLRDALYLRRFDTVTAARQLRTAKAYIRAIPRSVPR